LLAGQELIMWDESHVIAGRTLAAILTAEKYSDRLLGGNKLICVTNRFTQVALGNNVQVRGDMKRRVVPSRLVPDVEHPDDRADFRYPDLDGWVRDHRGELLGAVLTIWRNWIAKGRPEASTGMGSFERWARAVGGALHAAGIRGFRANTTEWLSYSEDDDGGWMEHLTQLRRRFGDRWFTVSAVADAVRAKYLEPPPIKHDRDKDLAAQLAYAYRGQREKWHGGLRLVRSQERDSATGGRTWTVQKRPSDGQDALDAQRGEENRRSKLPELRQAATDDSAASTDGGHDGQYLPRIMSRAETAGQGAITGKTDHPDDEYPPVGRVA
jgi:DNA polymerase-1